MSEVSMRQTMGKHIKALGSAAKWQRIEDSLSVGVPDIFCCVRGVNCWIEAKYVDPDDLPKRSSTPVRIGLRPEQALWLRDYKLAGGHAYVVCKIGREWFCFDDYFEQLVTGLRLEQLAEYSVSHWSGGFDYHLIPCYEVKQ